MEELRRNISVGKKGREKNTDSQEVSVVRITSEFEAPYIMHVEIEDLDLADVGMETRRRNRYSESEDKSENQRRNESVQFITLFSIILLFIICNVPRLILLVHEVIIIDQIK